MGENYWCLEKLIYGEELSLSTPIFSGVVEGWYKIKLIIYKLGISLVLGISRAWVTKIERILVHILDFVTCLINIYWYYLKLLLSIAYLYNAMERGFCGSIIHHG